MRQALPGLPTVLRAALAAAVGRRLFVTEKHRLYLVKEVYKSAFDPGAERSGLPAAGANGEKGAGRTAVAPFTGREGSGAQQNTANAPCAACR